MVVVRQSCDIRVAEHLVVTWPNNTTLVCISTISHVTSPLQDSLA